MAGMGYRQSYSSPTADLGNNLLQRRFLLAFAACGNLSQAAKWAHIDRQSHYNWLRYDPTYRQRFEAARQQAAQGLEDEAVRRAREGVSKPVLHKGKQVYVKGQPLYETEYSDTLLLALLKAHMPDKYKERVDFKFDWDGDPSKLSDQQLQTILYAAERAQLGKEEADKRLDARKRELAGEVIGVLPEPEVGPDGW